MAIERNTIFANGTAYDINATEQYILQLWQDYPDHINNHAVAMSLAALSDFRFMVEVDPDEMMYDLYTDLIMHMDFWFIAFGVESEIISIRDDLDDDDTLPTISISDDPAWDDDEEYIDSEEEGEMIIGAHVLAELYAEDRFDDMHYSDSDDDSDKENVAHDVTE